MIINSNLVSFEIRCTAPKKQKILTRTTAPHRLNQKQTTRTLVSKVLAVTSVFCILQARAQLKNSTLDNMTRISHMIEPHTCTQ